MVQGADGSWYAYFADIDAAMAADAAAAAAGPAGVGMDFGVFCSSATDKAVLGASFAYTEAVAVARPAAGGMNGGGGPLAECAHPIGGDLFTYETPWGAPAERLSCVIRSGAGSRHPS